MSVHSEEKRIVEQLGAAMMTKLSMNRYKPIWTMATQGYLLDLALEELNELRAAINTDNQRDVLMECADAANYLAMIADVALIKNHKPAQPARTDGNDDYDHKVSTHGEGW